MTTYELLTAAHKWSEIAAVLNGITTRRDRLSLYGGSTLNPPTLASSNIAPTWDFANGDEVFITWPIPDRIDRAVNCTLDVIGAPATTEASKQISLTIPTLSIDPVAGTLVTAAATGTLALTDQAVSSTAETIEHFTITVDAATYLGADVEALSLNLSRVAATTDLAGAWRLVGLFMQYTIER